MDNLPFVDEHCVEIAADPPTVWQQLIARVPRFTGSGTFARLLGAEPARACAGPIVEGATLPGFEVTEAVAGQRLRLSGRHRFARYELVFTLTAHPGNGTTLCARTNAAFPGWKGRLYRMVVIGSGGHRLLVVRLLYVIRGGVDG